MSFWKKRSRRSKSDVDYKMRMLRSEIRHNQEAGNELKHLLNEFLASLVGKNTAESRDKDN